MQNLAVHWHEGLFLRPHHLQAWDRHWHENTAASQRWQSPYTYGLARVAINPDALAAGFFQLDSIRAKMPDGTLVEVVPGEPTERIDLRTGFAEPENGSPTLPIRGGKSVDVLLAVPRLQLGDANVAETGQGGGARFRQLQAHVPDEADGASIEPIIFRRVNARLMLSTDDLAGYDTLRIARVIRGSAGGVIAELDDRYVPPLLDCAAWPRVRQVTLRPIHDMIIAKIDLLSKLVCDQGSDLDAAQPGDLKRIMMLGMLNQAATVLDVINHSGGVHPWTAYLELSRVAGSLDIFSPLRSAEPIAPYDHDAIGPLLDALRRRIESRLSTVGQNTYQQRFFVGSGMGMQVNLDPKWLLGGWTCVVGVNRGKLTPQALEKILSTGYLDWKIGSSRQVEMLFRKRASGVELKVLREVPKELPAQSGWSYFQIGGRGPAWTDVLETGTLAIRLREELIENRQQNEGSQTLDVRVDDHRMTLQFAVFAMNGSSRP